MEEEVLKEEISHENNVVEMEENQFIDVSNIKQWNPEDLPENFFMLIASKRRSGKTHLTRHILKPIKKRFKKCYLFSETAHLQNPDPYDYIPDENRFDHFDEEAINGILKSQNLIKQQNKKLKKHLQVPNPILIILDDVIADNAVRKSHSLKSLATQGRHSDVSVICLSQTISARSGFPAVIRQNVDIFICFTLHDVFNRETASECYASIISKKEGMLLINSLTQEKKYQVAVFDLSKTHVKHYQDYVYKYTAPSSTPSFKIGIAEARKGPIQKTGKSFQWNMGGNNFLNVGVSIMLDKDQPHNGGISNISF